MHTKREFEWDEAKRLSNIEKHGLDFEDAVTLFDGQHIIAPAKMAGNEARFFATGQIGDFYVTAVYTLRGNTIRMISFRRARHAERARL